MAAAASLLRSAASTATYVVQLLALRLLHAAFVTLLAAQASAEWLWRLSRPAAPSSPRDAVPSHVGVVVSSAESADVAQVARVVRACADEGASFVTMCDARGDFVRSAADLRAALRAVGMADVHVLFAGESPPPPSTPARRLCVRVVALGTGRHDIVDAAQRICERVAAGALQPDAVDEAAVEAELRANAGFPEPVRRRSFRPSVVPCAT